MPFRTVAAVITKSARHARIPDKEPGDPDLPFEPMLRSFKRKKVADEELRQLEKRFPIVGLQFMLLLKHEQSRSDEAVQFGTIIDDASDVHPRPIHEEAGVDSNSAASSAVPVALPLAGVVISRG